MSRAEGLAVDVVNMPIDHDWLARWHEEPLEPDLPIIDAHHHLWDRPHSRYMPPDLLADARGHNVVGTIYVENCAMYRPSGPVDLQPVGETEMVAELGSGPAAAEMNMCSGIVGYANLLLGGSVKPVLEAHVEAGRGRFRGIRQVTVWDPTISMRGLQSGPRPMMTKGMLSSEAFRRGFAVLGSMGLSFDAWLYHTQLPELLDLARAFPGTTIIINHVGGPVSVGTYAGRRDEVFAHWCGAMAELAKCPNVNVKIGGLGMRIFGCGFQYRETPPASEDLASAWRPHVEHCIQSFGSQRCMFESNFPVDKAYYAYGTLWNGFKRLSTGASAEERSNLFSETARRVYKL
jgi:predicted TIM-barrel fold metal-dependent hydrolase